MEENLSILCVDGNSVINRAYFGMPSMTSPNTGEPTNAIAGFLNIVGKAMKEYSPSGICVAFDRREKTFRHKLYENYKAGRRHMPDDLYSQMCRLKELLQTLGVQIYELAGYEADDIIGTISNICAKYYNKCYILTSDKDTYQLIGDFVTILHPGKDIREITPDTLFEKYGLTSREMPHLKALQGDASDKIPGVAGIGEKSALELIKQFKSIDNVYENIDLTGKYQKKLSAGRDNAYLSHKLGKIDTDVPINFDIIGITNRTPDNPTTEQLFKELGLGKRYSDIWLGSNIPSFSETI